MHRLDRETSGAFVVARNAASAAWLSAAFARKSGAAAAAPAARGSGSAATPASAQGCIRKLPVSGSQDLPWISRSYWAVVEAGWALPATGAVSEPVVTKQDGRRIEQQALTHYRTLAQDHGLAWLELTPVTGAQHRSPTPFRGHELHMHAHHCKQLCVCFCALVSDYSSSTGMMKTFSSMQLKTLHLGSFARALDLSLLMAKSQVRVQSMKWLNRGAGLRRAQASVAAALRTRLGVSHSWRWSIRHLSLCSAAFIARVLAGCYPELEHGCSSQQRCSRQLRQHLWR